MKRTLVSEIGKFTGSEVKICGWTHRIRKLSRIAFLIVQDRSGLVQCVIDPLRIDISSLKLESVIEITGTVTEGNNSTGNFEVQVKSLNVISAVNEDLPFEVNGRDVNSNLDILLDNRVLSLRNPKLRSIFKVQACLVQGFSQYLKDNGFMQIFTPKIVSEGAEGGTALFEVKYFEKKAYLAQSPQFYKQMMVASGYERVFEVCQVYRAEEHNTVRHLNEYVSMDFEMGFIKDEKDIMEVETGLLKYMFNKLENECKNELEAFDASVPKIGDFIPSMRLSEAIEILNRSYGKKLDGDLDPEGEKLIGRYAEEKLGSELLFLTHYPKFKRPMYAMPAEETSTHSFDLLFRGLEITTGGQRIHDYEMLKESMISRGLNPSNYESYLNAFKYGMPPHGGLAIGLERLTAQILRLKNIREATLFPRDRDRLIP